MQPGEFAVVAVIAGVGGEGGGLGGLGFRFGAGGFGAVEGGTHDKPKLVVALRSHTSEANMRPLGGA